MSGSITRRDFLNGVALSIGAGLTPRAAVAAAPLRYPPALTGMRGHHPGSFEVGHALAREGRSYAIKGMPIEEHYDLVVVGAGLSGLAAAYFHRGVAGPRARILVLDNHDDFGGHAKRNEFRLGDRLILGYGGSELLQSPKSLFGKVAAPPAARARGRPRPLRAGVRAHALSLARPLPRRVLQPRGVRARRPGHRRPDADGGRRHPGRSPQRKAGTRVRRRLSGLGGEQAAS